MTAALDEIDGAALADQPDRLRGHVPLVVRGLARDWPAVRAGREGQLDPYLRGHDAGVPAPAFLGPPEIEGRFDFQPDLRGVNFTTVPATVTQVLDQAARFAAQARPQSIYLGAAPMPQALPRFEAENPAPSLPAPAMPRLWLGNATTVQVHYDASDNLAVVVAGRRTFTLFPPEQIENLYVGPLDSTIAGQPTALARIETPDFARFARLRQALAAARSVELAPGDAIFIPSLWWHHVQAHDPLNALVNYWWEPGPREAGAPFEALAHAIWAIRHLPPERRAAWRGVFDHYVFEADDTTHAHIPDHARGVLGRLTPDLARSFLSFLGRALQRRERSL